MKAHGGEPIIPFSGIFENKLFDMPEDGKAAYCKEARPRRRPRKRCCNQRLLQPAPVSLELLP